LIVYGPKPQGSALSMLKQSNIEMRGRVSSPEIIRQCRAEAHAMLVPMSFSEQDRLNMEAGFPSKLADSTAVGVPVIIHGPKYSSAVRWACENLGVAEVVTDPTVDALLAALKRLQDPSRRLQLGAQAIDRCRKHFSHSRAASLIYGRLSESISGRRSPTGP
jgi:glycosyltransferase involved in cell wall biosynthesis